MTGQQQVRRLNVHEYVSMQIMAEHDIDIPVSKMAETPEEAEKACADIMGGDGEPSDVRSGMVLPFTGSVYFVLKAPRLRSSVLFIGKVNQECTARKPKRLHRS